MPSHFPPVPDARPAERAWPEMVWPVAPDVVLAGHTVELRPVAPSRDGADLFAALDDDRVWKHMTGRPGTAEEYLEQLARALAVGRLP